MKTPLLLALVAAAGALAYISRTAPEQVFDEPTAPLLQGPAPQVLLTEPSSGQVLREFEVQNMCCTNCTGTLHASLSNVPGVAAAAVSYEAAAAYVICDAEVEVDELLAALNIDKYQASPKP